MAADIIQLPDITSVYSGIIDLLGSEQADRINYNKSIADKELANINNLSNERIADFNLQGVKSQSEATRYAAEQAAGAQRFAATEGARAQIESTQLATASQERQIGLTGTQQRLLAVEQGGQERLNIETTGRQQRQTQADLLAGQERQIGLTGQEQRSTQKELLAGQERQIQMTGAEQRSTIQEQARQDRETALQSELFRRYKEQKDQNDALRAFRA